MSRALCGPLYILASINQGSARGDEGCYANLEEVCDKSVAMCTALHVLFVDPFEAFPMVAAKRLSGLAFSLSREGICTPDGRQL